MEEDENPRQIESRQIQRLMNLIAELVYIDKFDPAVGTDKIESKLQKGEVFKLEHLRAFRMSKDEIIYNWLEYVGQVAKNYFITLGHTDPKSRLFQTVFPEQVWINIETFIKNLMDLPLWADAGLSETLFGGKQVSSFWSAIFSTGRTPQGMQVLPKPINLNGMIVPKGVE